MFKFKNTTSKQRGKWAESSINKGFNVHCFQLFTHTCARRAQFFKNFTDLAKNTPLEGTVGESIKECFNVNISVAPIKDQVKGKGRQKRNTTKAITNIYTNLKASTKCPRCKGKLIPLGEIEQRIIQNNVKFQDLRNELNKQTDINNIMLCADCGKIVIPYSPKQNFPVKPNRSMTMSELSNLCEMMYRGLP